MGQSKIKKETKAKLINSAVKIFAEKGFYKAKISDIVKDAGVAQGTFYLYFNSKSHCFREILLLLHNDTLNILKEKTDKNITLSDLIKIFIKRIFEVKNISKVFLFEAISSGNEFQKLYFEFKENFKNLFIKNIPFLRHRTKWTILAGFLREIIEQDILFEQKSLNDVFEKIDEFTIFFLKRNN